MNNKGITLIALVITIIVMLILATVTINFVIGENGIINRAKEAKMAMIDDIENDKASLEDLEYDIDTHLMETLERISLDELQDDTLNEELQKLILTVNITADNKTIKLPVKDENASDYNCVVNWGDETETTVNETNFNTVTHTYTNIGEYDIKISGTFKKVYIDGWASNYDGIRKKLTKIKQWGKTGLTSIDIQNCSNLTEIATPTRNSFNQLESVKFYGCTGITNIPEKLFANCTNVTEFGSTFSECTGLTNIPERLFANCTNVTNFEYTFSECTGITNIPDKLFANCPNVTNFRDTFYGCTGLLNIPEKLFANCPNVTSFRHIFSRCTGLTNIPEKLFTNCPNVTEFGGAFSGCKGVTNIPEKLFANCLNVENFFYTFSGCKGLTTLPQDLFDNCQNVESFIGTFDGCINLTGAPIPLWAEGRPGITETSGGEGCYAGCINLDDYEQIPVYWTISPTPD